MNVFIKPRIPLFIQIIIGIVKFFVVCLGGLFLGILAGIVSAVLTKFSAHVKGKFICGIKRQIDEDVSK